MRLAPYIIFLVEDADGFGPAISEALLPSPNSNLRRDSSSFDLPLDKYGITHQKASGDLIQFLDPHGSPQVSILVVPNYGPPIAACAIREVLSLIASEDFSNQPTILLPFIMKTLKFNQDIMSPTSPKQDVTVYGAEIGAKTDFTQAMIAGTSAAPPSLSIKNEPLACVLQMVRVLNFPTVLLIASAGQGQKKRSRDQELEAMYEVGQFLAGHVGLCFARDSLRWKQTERTKGAQEPWRALYG